MLRHFYCLHPYSEANDPYTFEGRVYCSKQCWEKESFHQYVPIIEHKFDAKKESPSAHGSNRRPSLTELEPFSTPRMVEAATLKKQPIAKSPFSPERDPHLPPISDCYRAGSSSHSAHPSPEAGSMLRTSSPVIDRLAQPHGLTSPATAGSKSRSHSPALPHPHAQLPHLDRDAGGIDAVLVERTSPPKHSHHALQLHAPSPARIPQLAHLEVDAREREAKADGPASGSKHASRPGSATRDAHLQPLSHHSPVVQQLEVADSKSEGPSSGSKPVRPRSATRDLQPISNPHLPASLLPLDKTAGHK